MKNILFSLVNFNLKLKGGIFLFRHFLFTSIPVIIVIMLQLEVNSPAKWLSVLPAMYLIAVNDYNRLYTLFKNPLPIFMIMVLISVVCGIFPNELLWLSSLGIFFRILLVFNIGNKQIEQNQNLINQKNSSNMKTFLETNRKMIIYINLIVAYIFYLNINEHIRLVENNLRYQIGNIAEFTGSTGFLLIYVIYKNIRNQKIELLPFIVLLWFSMYINWWSLSS
ncbi:hypothetical protein N8692_03820 [Flavobacteriales bacterium]|nr:hypothetical protein [Flavobacteriales bacterium]MDC3390246.1 hypothetical protein [Flavobacteriales bacterium]